MSKFKIGDRVKIISLNETFNSTKFLNTEHVITCIDCNIRLHGVPGSWSERDLELVESESFIESVIAGKRVQFPGKTFKNGKFIGYTVAFLSAERPDRVTFTMTVDKDGNCVDTSKHWHVVENSRLELQQDVDKLTIHTVVYKLGPSSGWQLREFTDAELSHKRNLFHEYKIVETRYE